MLEDWKSYYGGNLLIVLPDAFGTDAFLRDAPDWVADWTGFRPDSAPAIEGGEKIIAWWRSKGRDPAREAADLLGRARRRHDRGGLPPLQGQGAHGVRLGHQPHQRFRRLLAVPNQRLDPISLVCKVTSANGHPAVKLSDNPEKATGDAKEIARYLGSSATRAAWSKWSRCEGRRRASPR